MLGFKSQFIEMFRSCKNTTLSNIAKITMGQSPDSSSYNDNKDGEEFDTVSDTPRLVGKKLVCEVTHAEGNKPNKEGKIPVFANIGKVIGAYEETGEVITSTVSARQVIVTDDLD